MLRCGIAEPQCSFLVSLQKNQAFNFVVFMEKCEKKVSEELQAARMIELRKSLNFIKETEWQYEPIEKHIGQA